MSSRRIRSMRLLKEVSEVESVLRERKASLTTVSQLQSFLQNEKRQGQKTYSLDQKRELLQEISGRSYFGFLQMLR